MSTISRAHRIQLTVAAATLAVALVGGIASAFAQSAGGNGGHGGGSGASGAGGETSAVIVYGTPGNCPPTIACGAPPTHRVPPRIFHGRPRDTCGGYRPGTRRWLECRDEM